MKIFQDSQDFRERRRGRSLASCLFLARIQRAEPPEAEIAKLRTDISQYTRGETRDGGVFSSNGYLDAHIYDSNIKCVHTSQYTHTHTCTWSEVTLDRACDAVN